MEEAEPARPAESERERERKRDICAVYYYWLKPFLLVFLSCLFRHSYSSLLIVYNKNLQKPTPSHSYIYNYYCISTPFPSFDVHFSFLFSFVPSF